MRRLSFAAALAGLCLALVVPTVARAAPEAPSAVTAPTGEPLKLIKPPVQPVRATPTRGWWPGYTEEKANVYKLGIAFAALALLAFGMYLDEKKKSGRFRRSRRAAMVLLGLAGIFAWFNFGKFHGGNFIHTWEHYHYYVGAKYFPELHYARLYECSAVAELDLGRRAIVEKRQIRDLATTNLIGPTTDVVAHPERCKQHFTPARWELFKADIDYFVREMGNSRWADSQKDHGYNATPFWNIGGSILANLIGPASDDTFKLLGLIDPALILLMFAFVGWAFGIEVFLVAAVFFGVNFPSRFYWNGGAYLRYDYLAAAVIGLCLLRKSKPALGGALLALSASLRIFPVMFVVGPALQGIWHFAKERKLPHELRRILLGCVLATAFLVPASFVVAHGGFSVIADFTHNTIKHTNTPLTNHMGLRTIVSWRPWDNSSRLKNPRLDDPFKVWKEERLANYSELKLLFLALNLAFLWAIWRSTRKDPAWIAATLSGTVLIASATELTCYYYAFLLAAAFLMEKRKEFGLWLIVMGMSTHIFSKLRIAYDEQHVWMSVVSLAFGVGVLWALLAPKTETETDAAPALASAGGSREKARG